MIQRARARSPRDRSLGSPCGSLAASGRAETLAAPTATRSDDLAAVAGGHARSEAVGAGPAEIVGLIGTLGHLETRLPLNPASRPTLGRRGRIDSSGSRPCQTEHDPTAGVPTTRDRRRDSSPVVASLIPRSIDRRNCRTSTKRRLARPRPSCGPTISRCRKPAWQANLRALGRANSLLLRAGSTRASTGFGFLEQFQADQISRLHATTAWRWSRSCVSIKKSMNIIHL
jgi:hypothetical protein